MAEPKNPYNNIEKELTLVGNPILDPDPVDVEVEDQPEIVEGMEITELEDGSVELGSQEVEPEDTSFMANLADQLDDDEIAGISAYVLEKVDEDKNARRDRDWETS